MAIGASVKKAIKSLYEAIPESEIKTLAEDGVKKIANSEAVTSTFKKGESSWLINYNKDKLSKPIEFLPGSPYTLKKRYTVPIAIGAGVYGMGKDLEQDITDARLSDMQADELSNTVNQSRSPNIASYENARNSSTRTKNELNEVRRRTPYELRDGGAAGDLVFALHELKGGAR